MMRSTPASVAVIALAVGAALSSAPSMATAVSPPSRQIPAQDPDLDAAARRALELLNGRRRSAGLEALQWNDALALLAHRQSVEQARRGRVSHHSFEFGLSTERRVLIAFPQAPRLAENVGRSRTLEGLHEALLRSEGHRRNRLDPEFTHVGIGLASAPPFLYLTEVFVSAPPGGLGEPVAYYFDAQPGAYERRDSPRVEQDGQVITVGPPGSDDPEHWTNIGIDAYGEGDLAGAEEAFRRALEIHADYHYAEYNLARVLVAMGAMDEAVVLLEGLMDRNPDDLDAVATRGTAAILMHDFAGAEVLFRRVLGVRTDDAGSWYNLGLSLEYLDRATEAATAYRRALELEPGMPAAQVGLGRVIRR